MSVGLRRLCRSTLALRLLMCHVMPDHASNGGTGQGMMTGNMSCNAPDHGALDAPRLGRQRRGKQGGTERQRSGEIADLVHMKDIPSESGPLRPWMSF
jgi:hypothetical protein